MNLFYSPLTIEKVGATEVDMRKSVLAVLGASAMALACTATSANAASAITGVTPASLTPPASALFGAVVTGTAEDSTPIDDTFTFNLTGGPAFANAQVSTILLNGSQNINFSSITLDSIYAFTKMSTDGAPETWALLAPPVLNNGEHSIEVIGTLLGSTGSYSGTLNVQAVPEPKTWAMMLLGFGAIGFSLRSRRRPQPALAQIA
jgi:PEP-CTERM motif